MKVFSQGVQKEKITFFVSTGSIEGDCTIERVALVMNIVSCRDLNLEGQL